MANPKHLEILKKGVEAWNKWRKNNPDIKPDLREANLLRANLSEANLSEANLSEANLWRADLSGANLNRANLAEAYLDGAHLEGAHLGYVDLEGAIYLTIEQLSKVKTFYQAKLDPELEKLIKKKYPHLLEEPREE